MSGYIKRADITNNCKVPHFFKSDEDIKDGKVFAYLVPAGLVEKMTISDVAPIRHSYWLQDGKGFSCRSCGRYENEKSPYCRLCGSVMDGGDEE